MLEQESLMPFKLVLIAIVVLSLLGTAGRPGLADQKDRDAQLKLALDELKAEVIVLERQVRSMQETTDKNSGQLNTLITQIVDNVNASDWDCTLENGALRLGLRMVGGLSETSGKKIASLKPFHSVMDVGLNRKEMRCLAAAGALRSLAG